MNKKSSSETWFDNKYRIRWELDKQLVEVHRGPIHPNDKPIATFSRKRVPSRKDFIKYALRAISKENY